MEPTGTLQAEVLADTDDKANIIGRSDATGFELKSTVDVYLKPGQMMYANLGMALCPPLGAELFLWSAKDMENKMWKLAGSRLASDITGEAMIPLRNVGILDVLVPKGTILARMLIEERSLPYRQGENNDRNRQVVGMPDRKLSDEAIAQWIENKSVLSETLSEEVKKHSRLVFSDMIDHNANDPASKRAEAERCTLRKLQDMAIADPDNTVVVTIDDAVEGGRSKKRMVKVNDRRSYVRGRPPIGEKDVQWADPTTLSAKTWNFSVSPSIMKMGKTLSNTDSNSQADLTKIRGVR